jgi:hypothetical protein
MKIIPTYIHGIMDYVGGAALLFAPEIFGFSEVGGAAVLIPRILGIVILLQALMTDYEVGLFPVISMRTHLMNDYVVSLFLAVSPWLFGFSDLPSNAWVPHVVVGMAVFVASLMTEQVRGRRPMRAAV